MEMMLCLDSGTEETDLNYTLVDLKTVLSLPIFLIFAFVLWQIYIDIILTICTVTRKYIVPVRDILKSLTFCRQYGNDLLIYVYLPCLIL